MENKKKTTLNEDSIERIYRELYGEYQPDEYSPKSQNKPKSKESEMDEGKLFTKLLMKK